MRDGAATNVPDAPHCACGSGLLAARCCGLDASAPPGTEATRHLAPLIERAVEARRHGAVDIAERLCLDLLEQAPDCTTALGILHEIRSAQGNQAAAEVLLRRIVTIDPNNFVATSQLALLLLTKGSLVEAELHARNAVRIAPEHPQAHNLMGMIMTEAQRPQIGEYHYLRVLELSGTRDPILLANLAWNLKTQGRMEQARALYQESVAAAPEVRQTLLGWARLEEADRQFDAAAEKLDRLEAMWPADAGIRLSRAVVLGRVKRYDEAVAVLDGIAQHSRDGWLDPNELLEKGRLLDRLGRYDDAFAAFCQAKRLAGELSGNQYLDQPAETQIMRLRGFFTAGRLRTIPRAGTRTDIAQPIFILGFPRSGTTLVEQTLSAHPQIAAGDELPLINDIADIMPRMLNSPLGYPEALAELWMGDQRAGLDDLRDYYLRKAAQMGAIEAGKNLVYRQDAAQRNASRSHCPVVPGIAADPCDPPSAGRHGLGVLEPFHPWPVLRQHAGDHSDTLYARDGSGGPLSGRNDDALPADPVRGSGGCAGSDGACHAGLHRR